MFRIIRLLVGMLIQTLIIGAFVIYGQSVSANLDGVTADVAGKPLAGITVTAVNQATGQSISVISSADGSYRIFGLRPGIYDITASVSNFTFQQRKGVQLNIGQTITIRFEINVNLKETVTISIESPIIEITQSQVNHVVSEQEINNLPINGRTFQQLAILSPGVTVARQIDPTKKRVGAVSVGGGAGRRLNSRVDGGDNNDDVVGSFLQQYSQDAVQEFVVVTDLYRAEDGFATDGLINVITKSGTNRFSGSAFLFLRDTSLNSRTYFEKQLGIQKPEFQRKQWGGIFGGPIIKDKSHFFISFERQDQKESAIFNTGTVFPTLNTIIPIPFKQNLFLAKVTGAIGNRQTYLIRVATDNGVEKGSGADGRHAPEATGITTNDFWSTLFNHNWTTGKNSLNQFTFQLNYYQNRITPTEPMNNFTVRTPTADFFRWTSAAQSTKQKKYQFRDDFSLNLPTDKGDHLFKIGGEYMYEPVAGGELQFFQNLFVYNTDNAITVVNGIPQPRPFSEVRPVSYMTFTGTGVFGEPLNWLGMYAQDDWRISPRLTLNLGVRYELQTGIWREHNVPGENRLRESGIQGRGPHNDTNNIAWRLGFAYNLFGNGHTVIRGGSGRFYDRVIVVTSYAGKFFEINPRFLPIQITNPTFGPLNIPSNLGAIDPASPSVRQDTVDAKNQNPYADQWSVGIAQEIGRGFLLDISYVHIKWNNLVMYLNINHRGPNGTRVLFPDLGDFGHVKTIGRGDYDGLKIRLQRRFSGGFQLQGSYTLSRRNSTPDAVSPVPLNQDDPLNKDEFGPTDNQENHRLVISGIARLPYGFQFSAIVQAASARPYTARVSGDINGDGVTGDRVEPYNSRRGTPTFTLDARLTKFFPLPRERSVELLFEVFNITNRANFGGFFVGNIASPNFGKPSGQLLTPPRQAQVGLRLHF
jgi:outer membrane receptor protein involved in Fe transport